MVNRWLENESSSAPLVLEGCNQSSPETKYWATVSLQRYISSKINRTWHVDCMKYRIWHRLGLYLVSSNSLLFHVLLELGEELLVERCINHLFKFLNMCPILSESDKHRVFICPLEIVKRRVGVRSCIDDRLVPGSIVHDLVDI
jgi:hypothetical protein